MDLNKINEEKNIYEKMRLGALLTAGTIDKYNTMTIGWLQTGVVWGKNIVTVYVRPSRYTFDFINNSDYFTVSFYDDKYKKELGYLGTKSGRDKNKVKDCNFHAVKINDCVTFEEAKLTILCKKIYVQDLEEKSVPVDVKDRYYDYDRNKNYEDFHRFYMGEIIEIK